MRNPYEPPHAAADCSKRHTRHPILLLVAVLFGMLTLLMGCGFVWGIYLFTVQVEFLEVPVLIIVATAFLGALSFMMTLLVARLALSE